MTRGRFRRDFYYRLHVFPISVPPLRDRPGDIPILTDHFVDLLSRRHGRTMPEVPPSLIAEFGAYDWPGNVRELEHVIERAIISSEDGVLRLTEPLRPELPPSVEAPSSALLSDIERLHIIRVLGGKSWRIEGRAGAAAALGLKPSTLRSRMHRLGIQRLAMT
jgi:formate hydrogenlyase transcriptional activator